VKRFAMPLSMTAVEQDGDCPRRFREGGDYVESLRLSSKRSRFMTLFQAAMKS
jgi:hypothetical protein